jgi:spermidine/putrescine transport system ATP-binding protein
MHLDIGGEKSIQLPTPSDLAIDGEITLAIRPEQARICGAEDAPIFEGKLAETIYIGTDTHYQIDIGTDSPFVIRVQNTSGEVPSLTQGDRVAIAIDSAVIQVLRD